MAEAKILLTGFGPFPGVPENPSAWLAEKLAASGAGSIAGYELHARVLPTEWSAVSRLAPPLLDEVSPRLIVQFGVSRRSQCFRVEGSAHNVIAARADASGAHPDKTAILADGNHRLDSSVPASVLARHLRTQGLAATASHHAGHYLCNFLYYLSLHWAARQQQPSLACFVHIPLAAAQGGPFSDAELLRGAKLILHRLLALASEQQSGSDLTVRSAALTTTLSEDCPCPSGAGN